VPRIHYQPRKVASRQRNPFTRQRIHRTHVPPSLEYPPRSHRSRGSGLLLMGVKALHTFVFVVMFGAILFLLYCGLVNHLSRGTVLAFVLISIEVTIYISHGFKCPLNTLAARLTPSGRRVDDIYLPAWLSSRVIAISTPLLAIACGLLLLRLLLR
jgi:hypothetical protein